MLIPIVLVCWYVITCTWAVNVDVAVNSTINLLTCLGLYYFASNTKYVRYIQVAFAITLVLNVIVGFLQTYTSFDMVPQAVSPAGMMANRNLLGSLIIVTIPFIIGLHPLKLLITGSVLLMLYCTTSRASMLSLLAMVVYYLLWDYRLGIRRYHKYLLILISFMLIGIGSYIYVQRDSAFSSGGKRLAYYRNAIAITSDRPLHGFGPGNFALIYYMYREPVMQTSDTSRNMWPMRLHNDWLQYAIELGWPGLLLYLSILLMALYKARNSMVGVALFGLSINAIMDFPLQMPTGAAIWWLLCGMANNRSKGADKCQWH